MKKTLCLLVLLIFLACSSEKKVEEISKKFPLIKLKLSNNGLERKGLWRQNLCISDIDADGNLDIVAPPPRGEDRPVIFLGDGKGNWREWKEVEFPKFSYSYGGVDVADLDKNGLPDIALACHSGRIYVLLQKEKGKFEDFSKGLPTADIFSSRVIKFVDFNGDGIMELLTLDEVGSRKGVLNVKKVFQKVFTLKNNKWEELPIIFDTYAPMCFGDNVVAEDFDLDGKVDFAISCHHFGDKEVLFLNKEKGFYPKSISSLPDSSYFYRVRESDFNKDGRPDLLFSCVFYNASDEAKQDREKALVSKLIVAYNFDKNWKTEEIFNYNSGKDFYKFYAISAGDLNNDGFNDIVALLSNGEIYVFLNKKDGKNFEKAEVDGFIKRGMSFWMDMKDINKDGLNDLIIAYGNEESGGNIDVYINETLGISAR